MDKTHKQQKQKNKKRKEKKIIKINNNGDNGIAVSQICYYSMCMCVFMCVWVFYIRYGLCTVCTKEREMSAGQGVGWLVPGWIRTAGSGRGSMHTCKHTFVHACTF